jgi:hypothetical protein
MEELQVKLVLMTSDVKPEKGSERVKAWVYAMLNPVIDSLRRETASLRSGDLSWRLHTKRCEYIRPIDELIDPAHQPILEDFLAEDPTFRERFSEHDVALAALGTAATEFFRRLVQAPIFQERVAECAREYETRRQPGDPTTPDLTDIVRKIPEYVAENVVNNAASLPRHHTMHGFWENFGPEFATFKDRGTFKATEDASRSLLQISEKLRLDLESLRLRLCREYDIPAAPIEPPRVASPENSLSRLRW